MPKENGCKLPPPLSDEQLSSYLDGLAGKDVQEHLDACAFCSDRLQAMREFDNKLKVTLWRFDCPDSQVLTDYVMDFLSTPERKNVERHLAICIACKEEIAVLRRFLENDEDTVEQSETTLSPIPKLNIFNEMIAATALEVSVGTLRGNLSGPIIIQVNEVLSLVLEFKELVKGIVCNGQILAQDTETWSGALVQIFGNEDLLCTTQVGDLGYFECEIDALTSLTLRITAASGEVISAQNIRLDDS